MEMFVSFSVLVYRSYQGTGALRRNYTIVKKKKRAVRRSPRLKEPNKSRTTLVSYRYCPPI